MDIIKVVSRTRNLDEACRVLKCSRPTLTAKLQEMFPDKKDNKSWKYYLNNYITEHDKKVIELNYAVGVDRLCKELGKHKEAIINAASDRTKEYWGIKEETDSLDTFDLEFRKVCSDSGITLREGAIYAKRYLTDREGGNNKKYEGDAYLYVIYFPELDVYKVGVTKMPKTRFGSFGHKYEICSLLKGDYMLCSSVESYLLYRANRVYTKELKNGNTETYRRVRPPKNNEGFLVPFEK